jgi:hypothetical protein
MFQKYYIVLIFCLLINSCNKSDKPFEKIHGRIIPDNDKYFKVENIINNNDILIDINKYDEEIIYSDNRKYIIKIYSNIQTKELEKYSDEYYNTFIYKKNEWYNILNVIRISDNKEIINNYFINPDEKLLIYNDKIYCHRMNIIYELDLINITEKVKYVYDKLVTVKLKEIINEYLILSIEEYRLFGFQEDGYIPIKKEFKIKI